MVNNDDILYLDVAQRRFIRSYKMMAALTIVSAVAAIWLNMVIVSNIKQYGELSQQWKDCDFNLAQVQLCVSQMDIQDYGIFNTKDTQTSVEANTKLKAIFATRLKILDSSITATQKLLPEYKQSVIHLHQIDSISNVVFELNDEMFAQQSNSKSISLTKSLLDKSLTMLNTELLQLHEILGHAESNNAISIVHYQEQYSAFLNLLCICALILISAGAIWGAKLASIMKKNSVNRYKQYKTMMGSFDKNQQLLIELGESEKKIRRITNTIPGTVCQYRISSDLSRLSYIFISEGSKKLFGYEPHEFLEDSNLIQKNIPEEYYSKIIEQTKHSIEYNTLLELEFPYNHPVDNRQMWIHTTALPEVLGNDYVEMYCIFSDITDVKEAIGAMHNSEKQLLDISHAIPGVVYQLQMHPSGQRDYLFISSGTSELFGLSSEEITRNPYTISEKIHKDDLQGIGQKITAAMNTLSIYQYEYRYIMPNGTERWISELSVPELQQDGSIIWSGILTDTTERKIQQEALRHSEEMLNEAQGIAQLGSWELDMRSGTMRWSAHMYKIAGFDPTLPPPDFSDVMMYNVLKRDIKKWYKSIYACVEGVNRFDWDMNVVTNAGERKIFHIMGKVAADEFGNIVKIVGTAQDITERTKIQEQLQRANTVVENSTSVLFRWEYNPDWQMTYISSNVKQWGYEPEQLVGSNEVISQFVHPDDIEQLVNNVNQHHAAHNTRYTLEYRLRNSNNEYRWVEERDFVTVDGDNRIVKIEGIITDINDRKVAEVQLQSKMLELHRQDYLLKVTAESLKQIVTTAEDFDAMMKRAIGQIAEAMDTDRIFMYETTQIENTEETLSALQYSWSRIEHEPHEVFKNILPKRLGLDEIAVQMLNGKIFRQNLDVINTKAKRLLKMYGVQSIVAIPIFLRNKFWGFIMMHDCNKQREWLDFEINVLTGAAASMAGSIERNRAERKLKEYAEYLKDAKSKLEVQAHELLESNRELLLAREVAETSNKAKSAFLSSMSHELRTPLNAVLGFTQILKKDEQLNKQHHKYLDTMYNSGQHLLAMINDILDVSKIEAGKIELQLDHVSIENFCTELRSMFQVRCTEKQLSYSVSLRQSVPDYIRADVVRLRQVMINLIGNAVKFTPPGGSVAVVIDCVGTSNNSNEAILRFEVRDTGRGIPDNQLKTIFEPFRQVNGMYSEGTGLGLAISSKLVSLMQGDLRVQSTVNVGSVFTFEVPFEIGQVTTQPKSVFHQTVIAIEGQKKYSVLLVDDIQSNRDVIRGMLEPLGVNIQEAQNGKEALEVLNTFIPDIIFLDLLMPVMNGEETIAEIRKQSKFNTIPVIAITASGFDGKREEVISTGFNEYIHKPFKEEDLFLVMERFAGCRFIYKPTEYTEITEVVQGGTAQEASALNIITLIRSLPSHTAAELQEAIEIQDFDAVRSIVGSIELFDDQQKQVLAQLGNAAAENNFRLFLEMSNSLN